MVPTARAQGTANAPGTLPAEQRERLTALTSTWEELRASGVDADPLDMIRCAHWVLYAQELEVPGWPPSPPAEQAPLLPLQGVA